MLRPQPQQAQRRLRRAQHRQAIAAAMSRSKREIPDADAPRLATRQGLLAYFAV